MRHVFGNGYLDEIASVGVLFLGGYLIYKGQTESGIGLVSIMLGYVFGRAREINKE